MVVRSAVTGPDSSWVLMQHTEVTKIRKKNTHFIIIIMKIIYKGRELTLLSERG